MFIEQLPNADFNFARRHGTHQFPLTDGGHVTAISQPSWDGFERALDSVEDPGAYVISPELIVASPKPDTLEGLPSLIERRIDRTLAASERMPNTTIVLGALTLSTRRPRNEVLFIRDGEMTGHSPKLPYLGAEAAIFHQAYNPAEHQQPDRSTAAMICSDLLFHRWRGLYQEGVPNRDLRAEYVDPIGPDVRTLLVSACWITPYFPGEIRPEQEDARFLGPLRYATRLLMDRHPQLQDVIMADQLPVGIQASGPVNFHARRA